MRRRGCCCWSHHRCVSRRLWGQWVRCLWRWQRCSILSRSTWRINMQLIILEQKYNSRFWEGIRLFNLSSIFFVATCTYIYVKQFCNYFSKDYCRLLSFSRTNQCFCKWPQKAFSNVIYFQYQTCNWTHRCDVRVFLKTNSRNKH